jgi:Rrf2 family protein
MALLHMDRMDRSRPVPAKALSEDCRIPLEIMGKVLQMLSKSGLAESVQGARGGYRLVRKLEDIALGEVIQAIDGPIHLTTCQDHPESCMRYDSCTIRHPVMDFQSQLNEYVYGVKVADFRSPAALQEAAPRELASHGPGA